MLRLAILTSLFFSTFLLAAEIPVPEKKGVLNDYAQVIYKEEKPIVEDAIKSLAPDIILNVLTVKTLNGETIESFARRVMDKWKPGQKGKDNGLLFIIAINDRKMRLELGKGLEGTINDACAGDIIREAAPLFKEQKYARGIVQVVIATRLSSKLNPVREESPEEILDKAIELGARAVSFLLILFFYLWIYKKYLKPRIGMLMMKMGFGKLSDGKNAYEGWIGGYYDTDGDSDSGGDSGGGGASGSW